MGLSSVLNTALTALNNSQRAISVTANNVANVNTAGYSRQIHQQEALVRNGDGVGVRSDDATRMVDDFLAKELRIQTGKAARSEVLDTYLERAQSEALGGPDNPDGSITGRISALSEAAQLLAGTPESSPLRSAFLGEAEALAKTLNDARDSVQDLRGEIDQRIAGVVEDINDQIGQLDDVNREIARSGATAGLADRRDAIVAGIAEQLDVTTYVQDNGQIAVYARGGQPLLEGNPRTLVYSPSSNVTAQTRFGAIEVYARKDIDPATGDPVAGANGRTLVTGGLRTSPTAAELAAAADPTSLAITSPLTSGRLQGLLESRDALLPAMADQLGELAGLTTFALNAAHNDAVVQPPVTSFTGATRDTGAFDAAIRSGTAYLALVDRTTGDATQTIAIDVTQDRDTLVGSLNAALGGQGTATLDAEGRLTIATSDPNLGMALSAGSSSIAVSGADGRTRSYGLAHYFGLNDLFTDTSGVLSVRQDMVDDPSLLGSARLDVTVGPPLTATLGGSGDARGIGGVADAFQQSLGTIARGDLPSGSATLGEYAADVVALAANHSSQAARRAGGDQALLEDLASRNASVSGVNVDEELSMLVVYQQGYSVAARLFSITNEMFDDLVNLGR